MHRTFNQNTTKVPLEEGGFKTNFSVNNTLSDSAYINIPSEPNANDVYLAGQDRVRLLSFDADGQWKVSALVLQAGTTFGADYLLCNRWLLYGAIAASEGQIAP